MSFLQSILAGGNCLYICDQAIKHNADTYSEHFTPMTLFKVDKYIFQEVFEYLYQLFNIYFYYNQFIIMKDVNTTVLFHIFNTNMKYYLDVGMKEKTLPAVNCMCCSSLSFS